MNDHRRIAGPRRCPAWALAGLLAGAAWGAWVCRLDLASATEDRALLLVAPALLALDAVSYLALRVAGRANSWWRAGHGAFFCFFAGFGLAGVAVRLVAA